jgi:uncharacterized protein YbjQ (UPF0145 family)
LDRPCALLYFSYMNIKHQHVTGLSGNEIFCLNLIDYRPGQLCVGNSVMALGVVGGLGAGFATLGGGEVTEITNLVHDARTHALARLTQEARQYAGQGVTGVSFELINHGGNLEFITLGSTVRSTALPPDLQFTTSSNAQQLYCQIDAGFTPVQFVFGNVAYSIGVGGNIMGRLRSYARGEVADYTEIFDRTRHLALERITAEGKKHGAHAILGIETTIAPLLGTQEMLMVGTASRHPLLQAHADSPVTSDMTPEETWNMVHLGYMPLRLVMGVSVYSLGLVGRVGTAWGSLRGGKLEGLTELLYEAREKALARIERDADACGADEVVGVKIRVYDLGSGLIEFMAIGTAVKKVAGASTKTAALPAQAIISDRETFVDTAAGSAIDLGSRASATRTQRGPFAVIFSTLLIAGYLLMQWLLWKARHPQ